MLNAESNVVGGFVVSGSPLRPYLLLLFTIICRCLGSFLLVTSWEAMSEEEGGRMVPTAGDSSSFSITCNGDSRRSELSPKSAPKAGGGHAAEPVAGECLALPLVSSVGSISPVSISKFVKGH